jgi:hypothetical protein
MRTASTLALGIIVFVVGCSANGSSNASFAGAGGAGGAMNPPPGGAVFTTSGGASGAPSAPGGAPGSSGASGKAGDTSGLRDPTAFVWPESSPDGGQLSLCKAGHYVGTYKCAVKFPPPFGGPGDAGAYEISGPVDFELQESQEGEFLVVNGGTLSSGAGFYAFGATVLGKLDCVTGTFQGELKDGTVAIPPFPPGGTFTGDLASTFDSGASKLTGTWNLIGGPEFSGTSCHGPWNATWQGS